MFLIHTAISDIKAIFNRRRNPLCCPFLCDAKKQTVVFSGNPLVQIHYNEELFYQRSMDGVKN